MVAVDLDMGLVLPQGRRGGHYRQRHGGRAIGPQPPEFRNQLRISGGESGAQAGGPGTLRQGIENQHIIQAFTQVGGRPKAPRRRRLAVNLAIALIENQGETVTPGQGDGLAQTLRPGHRALRIGR